MTKATDEQYMQLALEEAKKGVGFTSPNPAVGAVIVKNGRVLSVGYHKKAGMPHAEREALAKLGGVAKGATLYVTLEPCCHTGKTPPCTEAIIAAGISRVVVGMRDPFGQVNGKGLQILKKKKIAVHVIDTHSDLSFAIRSINQPFLKSVETGFPYVTLKAGVSLDGAIATRTGSSQWITSREARDDARLERSQADAVLVGSGTVLADDPELAPHGPWKKKSLLRVILDPTLALPTTKKVFRDEYVFVATTDQAVEARKKAFVKAGIEFASFGKSRVSIPKLLQYLHTKNVRHLFVEGGSGVHGSFVDAAEKEPLCVDHILFYIAPKIVGGRSATHVVGGMGVSHVDDALQFEHVTVDIVGSEVRVDGFCTTY